jgi:general secretion pathway protein K
MTPAMTLRQLGPETGGRETRRAAGQRGAALLIAMIITVLVSTLAAGMVWQQWRSIQVESAERARTQSAWILNGALDWARLILREDARSARATSLNEPWATPLAEARLSSFLALDKDNNADSGPDAFLSGTIVDAQSRYNLRNLIEGDKVKPEELRILQRLCEGVGAPTDTAQRIADGLLAAAAAQPSSPIALRAVSDLVWLGLDPATVERLRPQIELLPQRTPLNLNTAPRETIAAVVEGLDLGTADRLVRLRQSRAFESPEDLRRVIPATIALPSGLVGVRSEHFEIRGRLRLEDRVLEERSLVQRRGLDVVVIQRERVSQLVGDR